MKTLKCMLLAAGVSCFALAGNVVYTGGGTGALSDGDAWEGGVAPGADDVAVFTNDFSGTLSQPTAWGGVRVTAGTNELAGAELSLGAGGIVAEAGRLSIAAPVAFVDDTTIQISFGATVELNAQVEKNGHAVSVQNAGALRLGKMGTGPVAFDWGTGDSMSFTGSGSGSNTGLLDLCNVNTVVDAAALYGNWLTLSQGTWDHRSGSLQTGYAIALGSEAGDGSRFVVNGGTVNARRFVVGVANTTTNVAEMIVSNGMATATSTARSGGGVEIGTFKSPWSSRSSDAPEGRLTVAGGKLATSHVRFGSDLGAWSGAIKSGYGQVVLSGGELELKGEGIFVSGGNYWQSTFDNSAHWSWHDVTLSGGTLSASANNEVSVRVRLSDADGGATASVAAGQNLAFTQGLYGSGSLRKAGPGNLRFSAISTFTGRLDVAEGTVTLGYAPTAIFRADDLSEGAGEEVSTWVCSYGGSWTFNRTVATAVNNKSTTPKIAPETINGHKAIRFDGIANALGISGSASVPAPPVSGKKSLTVFAVVRATDVPSVGDRTDWRQMTQVVGAVGGPSGTPTLWAMCVDADGYAGAGVSYGSSTTNYSAWGSAPLTDGRAHVLGFRWSAGSSVSFADGLATTAQSAPGCTNAMHRTRVLLGMSEAKKFFSGDVAEIVVYNDMRLSDAAYRMIGYELALKYDASFEFAEPDDEVPEPDAVWSADSLSQQAGESVTEWACANEGAQADWKFNATTAKAITSAATSPVISPNTFNGHKAVSFNGTTDMLAITKNVSGDHVFSGVTNLTVAVVFRAPEGSGSGLASAGWPTCAGLIAANASTPAWGISLTGNGRMGMGVRKNSTAGEAAWSQPRHLNDGLPHVAVFSYQGGNALRSVVDGYRLFNATYANFALLKQRVILGMNEGKHHFAGEIAELRIYRDVAMDLNVMHALWLDLARKYGCDHYTFDGNLGSALASAHVAVAQDAVFNTGLGYTVPDGQVWSGAGSVSGTLNVASNGVVSTADGNLSVANLLLEPGAVLDVSSAANGLVTNAVQVGDLTLPSGEVTLRVRGGSSASAGVFLRWTGTLRDNGATWNVLGAGGAAQVRLDVSAKTLKLSPASGTMLMIR